MVWFWKYAFVRSVNYMNMKWTMFDSGNWNGSHLRMIWNSFKNQIVSFQIKYIQIKSNQIPIPFNSNPIKPIPTWMTCMRDIEEEEDYDGCFVRGVGEGWGLHLSCSAGCVGMASTCIYCDLQHFVWNNHFKVVGCCLVWMSFLVGK